MFNQRNIRGGNDRYTCGIPWMTRINIYFIYKTKRVWIRRKRRTSRLVLPLTVK
jgi:hypothetical protein